MGEMDRWNNRIWPFQEGKWPENFRETCREFFATESTRFAGLDLYDDVFETPLFFPLQRKQELRRMMQEARTVANRVVMEIGADKGGGFYHLVKGLRPELAIACEIRGTPYRDLFEQHFPQTEFLWIECGSRDIGVLDSVNRILNGRTIDVLFIDGDKNGTLADFEAYSPLVSRPGRVFIHDINGDPPTKAFNKIAETHETEAIFDLTDVSEALARQAAGLPEHSPYEQWLRYWYGRSCGVGVVRL